MSDGANHANLAVAVISEDIRHVHLRATAALGIAAVFVTQIDLDKLQALPHCYRVLITVGMGLLLISSVAYFLYSQELNKARIRVGKRGTLTCESIAEDWPQSAGGHGKWLVLYGAGQVCFVAGLICLGIVIGRLFLG